MAELGVLIVQLIYIRQYIKVRIFDYSQLIRINLCSVIPVFLIVLLRNVSNGVFLRLLITAISYFGVYFLLAIIFNVRIVKDNTFNILKKIGLLK